MLIDNVRDAIQRYRNMYGIHTSSNSYVQVLDVGGSDKDIVAAVRDVITNKELNVPVSSLNMNSFSFGFMFSEKLKLGMCVSRQPRRETHQGLSSSYLGLDSMTNSKYPTHRLSDIKSKLMYDIGFINMVNGIFNFNREKMSYLAELGVEEDLPPTHYPLSKNFSLHQSKDLPDTLLLTYLGEFSVGKWDNGEVILNKKHLILEDQLVRANIGVK